MELVVVFILEVLIGGGTLWVACKVTAIDLEFKETAIAAGAAALTSIIPGIGWLLSIIVLFWVLKYFSQVNIWPDLVLAVVVSRLLSVMLAAAVVTL